MATRHETRQGKTKSSMRTTEYPGIAKRMPQVDPVSLTGPAGVIPAAYDDRRLDGFELTQASEADHPEILDFLQDIFHEPTNIDFQHLIRQPRYEALDRMMIKQADEIVAHVQLSHRPLQWGSTVFPSIDLGHLATAHEFRSRGLAASLLDALNTDVNLHGALIATIRAKTPEYFLQRGWVPWLRPCHSTTSPRRLLAELAERAESTQSADLDIRQWRRNELDALRRLYRNIEPELYGGIARDEDDWKWLVSRQGFDYIYVARPHSETEDLDGDAILGYAVIVDGNVFELVEKPGSGACASLLTRVCRDAIEEGRHSVTMHASAENPIHNWFREAYGETQYASLSEDRYLMARIIDPVGFLRHMRPVLLERAMQADIELPFELGIQPLGTNSETPLRIHVNRRRVAITDSATAAAKVNLGPADFHRLLLGECSIDRLIAAKRAFADSPQAIEAARVLFPEQAGWRMPWDDMACRR